MAAWVFDGVTGINSGHQLPAPTDAFWLVQRAQRHMLEIASLDLALADILAVLVDRLMADWSGAMHHLTLPQDYDPPAACLLLAKKYDDGWRALRLGDSILVSDGEGAKLHPSPPSDLQGLEEKLRQEARRRRAAGQLDFKSLLAEFKPLLVANRKRRNTPGNYSILVADRSALRMPEVIHLGHPSSILLCTDGYFRAVDHYGQYQVDSLLAASARPGGVQSVLKSIRAVEQADPDCRQHLRFKPADDVSAICLTLS